MMKRVSDFRCDEVGVAQLVDLPAGRQGAGVFLNVSHYVYIINSKTTGKFYTGLTSDIKRRLKQHNRRLSNTPSTKNTADFDLVFCQIAETRTEARRLEIYLKSGSGREIREEIVK